MRFFWYRGSEWHQNRWAMRGIAVTKNNITYNAHYKALVGMYGYTWEARFLNLKGAWKNLLKVGW